MSKPMLSLADLLLFMPLGHVKNPTVHQLSYGGDTGGGYVLTFELAGEQIMVKSQRGSVRYFKGVEAAFNVVKRLGFERVSVQFLPCSVPDSTGESEHDHHNDRSLKSSSKKNKRKNRKK